jgi:hypothetical protein
LELQEKTPPSTPDNDVHEQICNSDEGVKSTTTNQTTEGKESHYERPVDPTSQEVDRKSINKQNMYRLWKGGDVWGCQKCAFRGDKWDVLSHICKNNK